MNILKYTKYFVSLSVFFICIGIYIIFTYGFKTSIEYTGGTVVKFKTSDIEFTNNPNFQNISTKFDVKEISKEEDIFSIKISETQSQQVQEFTLTLQENIAEIEIVDIEVVGSSVGIEFAKNSFLALIIALTGIILYVAYSFNGISEKVSSWYFGTASIIAIFHDLLLVISFFSLAGFLFNVEIDALFLTALLAIIGFSINDTIVVFDRIRENLIKHDKSKSLLEIFNVSISETLNRSITTSFTVIIIMFSLFLMGSGSIKFFALALVIGIAAGTYSSIFIATPMVLLLNKVRK
jgi:preprotein translocase subunit SecF